MNPKLSFLSVILVVLTISCSKQKENIEILSDSIIYSNSFENSMDLENIEGIEYFLSHDTPTGGGDSSLVVSGGCVTPHLYFELGPFDEVKNLSFNIYGKAENMYGAAVILRLANVPETYIAISVMNTDWTYYESGNTIEVPVGEKVIVEFQSGGIIPVTTFFDLLEIESN